LISVARSNITGSRKDIPPTLNVEDVTCPS
jgi:hypothetical protein